MNFSTTTFFFVDDLEFGVGSIIGVAVFGMAVLIVIVSLVASTVMKEKPATAV